MNGLDLPSNEHLLLGTESSDDAGIYQINDEQALVQTLDIITPVVDDPFLFGQIAAANSMSDIWAMGGKMLTAMNFVAYDNCHLTLDILREILAGGSDKVREAGGAILGGHTIEDIEMKYGLSVTGIVHPQKYLRNNTIQPGDLIILTKPLGMGVISTSIKGEMADEATIKEAGFQMAFLNKYASEAALRVGINAMTDVTGFGLIGHLNEMTAGQTAIELNYNKIPIIKAAFDLAEYGLFPAGAYRNEEYYEQFCKIEINKPDSHRMLLFDPQTSGGLLLSVPEAKAEKLLAELIDSGIESASIIGQVILKSKYNVIVRS